MAAPTRVQTSPPFATLTIDALDPALLRTGAYADALLKVAAGSGGRTFVAESTLRVDAPNLSDAIGPGLSRLLNSDQWITRLSIVQTPSLLNEDVSYLFDRVRDGLWERLLPFQWLRTRLHLDCLNFATVGSEYGEVAPRRLLAMAR